MSREVPASERIAAHFQGLIDDGSLGPGQKLPTIREIAETWRVARQTASNAVQLLRASGAVSTGGRAGTVVLGPAGDQSVVIALDGVEASAVRSVVVEKATSIVAGELGILPGAAVIVIRYEAQST